MSAALWCSKHILPDSAPPHHTCSHMLTALPPPESLRGAMGAADGCQYRQRGDSWHTITPAVCPDSNHNEEGVHALHKVCDLHNVSDAMCHLLCTSFYTSMTLFIAFPFFVKPSAWGSWQLLPFFRHNHYELKCLWQRKPFLPTRSYKLYFLIQDSKHFMCTGCGWVVRCCPLPVGGRSVWGPKRLDNDTCCSFDSYLY